MARAAPSQDETGAAPIFDAAVERASLTAALLAATSDLVRETEIESLLMRFSDLLVATSPHLRLAWFYVGEADADVIRPLYVSGPERDYGRSLAIGKSRLMMRGPVRRALKAQRSVVQRVPRKLGMTAQLFPDVRDWHRLARRAGIGAVLAMPFSLKENGEWGLSVLYADRYDYFDSVGEEPFLAFAQLAQVGIDHAMLKQKERHIREQVEHLSLYDRLTGLANRLLLHNRLVQALTQLNSDDAVTLALIDLDEFKNINDSLGLAAGDQVLIETGRRLRKLVGGADVVARLSADEFAVVLTGPRAPGIEQFFDALLAGLDRYMTVAGRRLQVTASIGAAVCGNAKTTADELMRQADLALHRAKRDGGNCCHFFEESLETSLKARHEIAVEVGAALERREFCLHYQPQLHLGRGVGRPVSDFEALIRWQHGRDGLLLPDRFLPQIEHTVLIERIGAWALETAAAQLAAWNAQGLTLRVGVNIAARHLLAPGFRDGIAALLERHPNIRPEQLEIEVTETTALRDLGEAHAVLSACRELGVRVALDDFGTGHASLAYLQRLPANRVKIDRNFVKDIVSRTADLAIVASTVIGAGLLGLDVVAEGVESYDHGLMLAKIGCAGLQGYAIAFPLPAEQVPEWLSRWRTPTEWLRYAAQPFQPQVFPLVAAEIAHRRTAETLLGAAAGPGGSDITGDSVGTCAFERWYESVGRQQFGAYPAFAPVAAAHEAFHAATGECLAALEHKNWAQLAALAPLLRSRSEVLTERLESLRATATAAASQY
jgi:diguanylate cyclase (GGDEF)-like protein